MKKKLLIVVALIFTAAMLFAKRAEPKKIEPIVFNGVEYSVGYSINETDMYAFVKAKTEKAGIAEEKTLELYHIKFDPRRETDVQWVFVKEFVLSGDKILIQNEKGKNFELELESFKVKKLEK